MARCPPLLESNCQQLWRRYTSNATASEFDDNADVREGQIMLSYTNTNSSAT